jgi:hypothetical protein
LKDLATLKQGPGEALYPGFSADEGGNSFFPGLEDFFPLEKWFFFWFLVWKYFFRCIRMPESL